MAENSKALPVEIVGSIAGFLRKEPGLKHAGWLLDGINKNIVAKQFPGAPGEEGHFLDCHREAIITRTLLVAPLLDALLDKKQLTQEEYELIRTKDTPQNKMRELYGFASRWDNAGKTLLYEALKANNGPLIRALGGQ